MHHVRQRRAVAAGAAPTAPAAFQLGHGDGNRPRARAVGVFLRVGHGCIGPTAGGNLQLVIVAVGLLRVVFVAHEVHARKPRAVRHLERNGALVAFALQLHIADLRFLGVVVERLVERLLCGIVGGKRCRAAQRVLAVGQLVAIAVQAVEHGLVRRVHVVILNVQVVANAVVVRGFGNPIVAEAFHGFAVGVQVIVGQRARVALHSGERNQARGSVRCRRRRHNRLFRVSVAVAVQRVFAQLAGRVLVHKRAAHNVLVAAAGNRIDGRLLVPVAVESQERRGQVNAALFGGQLHVTLNVGTVCSVFRYERFERVASLHVHHQRGAAAQLVVGVVGRNGNGVAHRVAAERHVNAAARPVVVAAGEHVRLDLLGHGRCVKRVGSRLLGQVVQLQREAPRTVGRFAHLALRAVHVGVLVGQVHGRGGCRLRVHQAGTLVARAVVRSGAFVNHGVGNGRRGGHKQLRHQHAFRGIGVPGKLAVGLNVLAHQRGNARHLRRCHRGARFVVVIVVRHR